MRLAHSLRAFSLLVLVSGTATAQFTEIEPNGDKPEATLAVGLTPGSTLQGSCDGNVEGAGNTNSTSVDTWEIETAAQAVPGWYQWTLTINPGHGLSIRAQSQSGVIGSGASVNPGSNVTGQASSETSTTPPNIVRWYSNENASRLYVRVTGSPTSPATYTATLSVSSITPTPVPGSFAGGNLTLTTRGQGHATDTDFCIASEHREVLVGYQNDDVFAAPVLQSELTRGFAPGTYYVLVSDFDLVTRNTAQTDDDFIGGDVADFDNVILNSSAIETRILDFAIEDGTNSTQVFATKDGDYAIEFFEFTVGAGNLIPYCFANGKLSPGCGTCSCGNDAPGGTLGGCLNSSGTSASLLASGSPTIGMDTLHFDVTGGNISTFGLLVSAPNQLPQMGPCSPGSGIISLTLDGLRCVGGGLIRHGSRTLDGTGSTTNGWGPPAGPMAGLSVQAGFVQGQTRNFQVFYRENPALGCGTGQASTNAINVTFL